MTPTLQVGWWIVPTVITFGSFLWALWPRADELYESGYGFAPGVVATFRLVGAVVATFTVWAVWSVLP